MSDFKTEFDRILAEAYESLDSGRVLLDPLLLSTPPLTEDELREIVEQVQVRKLAAYMPVSCCQLTDSTGVNHCDHPVWTPPPVPWHRRLRYRLRAWRSRLGQRIGSRLAGERLLTVDEAYDLRED